MKTVQELLRRANSRITLDVYTQAVNSYIRGSPALLFFKGGKVTDQIVDYAPKETIDQTVVRVARVTDSSTSRAQQEEIKNEFLKETARASKAESYRCPQLSSCTGDLQADSFVGSCNKSDTIL